jgi:hypothetical protein
VKRVYGRVEDLLGNKRWVEVTTDANGFDDEVNVTWMAQVFALNLGESPFYSDWGLPAHQSVMSMIAPDYFVNRTQQRFAPLFASLIIQKVPGGTPQQPPPFADPSPTYRVTVVSHSGAILPPRTFPTSIPT